MPAPPNYVFTIFALSFFLCLVRFSMHLRVKLLWHCLASSTDVIHTLSKNHVLAWNYDVISSSGPQVGLTYFPLGINTVDWTPAWCGVFASCSSGLCTNSQGGTYDSVRYICCYFQRSIAVFTLASGIVDFSSLVFGAQNHKLSLLTYWVWTPHHEHGSLSYL